MKAFIIWSKIFTIFLILSLGNSQLYGSFCSMIPVPLKDRVLESRIILEGKVVGFNYFKNETRKVIETRYALIPYKLFKGSIQDTIYFFQDGGIWGDEIYSIHPSAEISLGQVGVFLLKPSKNGKLSLVSGAQGVISYNIRTQNPEDIFYNYNSISDLETKIIQFSNQNSKSLKKDDFWIKTSSFKASPTVSKFSPLNITAGTNSKLIISGKDFGSSFGSSASIEMPKADDGGKTFLTVPSANITSWVDTQIQIIVPSGAGTGKIKITNPSGSTVTSSNDLNVTYNIATPVAASVAYFVRYADIDSKGGLTFIFNRGFNSVPAAVKSWKLSLQNWRCNTLANFAINTSSTTALDSAAVDGSNIIAYDSNNTLPTGVLGVTYSSYGSCLNSGTGKYTVYLKEVDQIYSRKYSWNYTTNAPSGSEIDFQSVATHELGHAHQLGHVIDNSKVMHFSIAFGNTRRTVDTVGAIPGVKEMLSRKLGCSSLKDMKKITGNSCFLISPIANFGADKFKVCAGDAIQLIDSSLNAPTSYEWDVDGDGKTDYTTLKAPKIIYTKKGIYSLTLKVSTGTSTSSITLKNLIQVYDSLKVSAGLDRSICIGDSILVGDLKALKGGVLPYKIKWIANPGVLNNENVATPFFKGKSSTSLTLTVKDSIGCTNQDDGTIKVNGLPKIKSGTNQNVCFETNKKLGTAPVISGGKKPFLYQWSPKVLVVSDTASLPTMALLFKGYLKLIVKDSNGCSSKMDSIYIKSLGKPKPTFQYIQFDGNKVTMVNNSTNGDTFLWTFENKNISNLKNPTYTYSQPGTYPVKLKAINDCYQDSITLTLKAVSVGIEDIAMIENIVSLYPNPASHSVFIKSNLKPSSVEIFNLDGKLMYANAKDISTEINISAFERGFYLVKIQTSLGVKSIKLLVE